MSIYFSCVIPAKNSSDPKLLDLIYSIKSQDFPQDRIEIHVVTEGDSESAKAIGIQKSVGEVCVMLCADNYFTDRTLFSKVYDCMLNGDHGAVHERHYAYIPNDNSLNRYFSLIGNNDPVPFYLGKCDREPWVRGLYRHRSFPSYGCNGFFVRRSWFRHTDLSHYYPMDAHVDMAAAGMTYKILNQGTVWHRTSDSLIPFLKKRYRYARDLYSDRGDRRWKMLDTKEDYWRLGFFIISTLAVIPSLLTSCKGFKETKDPAWFWHWPVCIGFLITYGVLACRNFLKRPSLSRPLDALKPLNAA